MNKGYAIMTTREQFDMMCGICTAERDDRRSAIDACSFTETTLDVFGWGFGIADIRKIIKEKLTGWSESAHHMTNSPSYHTFFKKDGFTIHLESMI